MEPASQLLLRNRSLFQGPALVIGAPEDGVVGELGQGSGSVTFDYGAWQRQGGEQSNWYWGYDQVPGDWRDVIVYMPKARSELAMRLVFAAAAVTQDGSLWLVGGKNEGVASGGKAFRSRFPDASKVDSARHCQLWSTCLGANEGVGGFNLKDWFSHWSLTLGGQHLELYGLPGIFSDGRLDAGTRMLLETFEVPPEGPVLDFACGSGVIGSWLLHRWPELKVDLSDTQWQAITCVRRLFADVTHARILPGDGLSAARGPYGTIVTNPPFHQGVKTDRAVTERFLRDVRRHLRPGGELRLVANSFLPYPQLIREALGEVETLADNGQYRVYRAFRAK